VTKCNRCGNMTPAGPMCQSCGAPLSSDAGFSQRMGAQEQSELPAWLESLRVGERPPTSAAAPSNFSTADFIDEGPLPIWMRSERAETPEPPNVPMPEHLAAFSDQAPDQGNFPPMGLAAQSLIDEKSLPSWMKDNKQPSTPPTGFSASSLLQQDSVPDWMKTLQPPSTTPPPSATPSSYKEQASKGPSRSFDQPNQPDRNAGLPSMGPASGGFSAHDLIDQQALPSWMKPQNERNAPVPQTEPFARPEPQGMNMNRSGLSASSLLDANSLPQWMRENGSDSKAKPEPPQSTWLASPATGWSDSHTPSTNSGWLEAQMPSSPSGAINATPAPGANLAASSFIDPNALPEWLRNASDSRPQTGQPAQPDRLGGAKQGAYSVPPRVDNVRVPSRPRGSDPASESSEVAANAFASMLGVASTVPNYPGQPPSSQGGFNPPPAQGGSYPPPSQGNPYQQLSQGGAYQQSGQLGQSGMSAGSLPNSGAFPNPSQNMGGASPYGSLDSSVNMQSKQSYGNSLSNNNSNQLGSSPSMGSSYYSGNAASSSPSASHSAEATNDQKNAKKRGLFGAFLDWLSR